MRSCLGARSLGQVQGWQGRAERKNAFQAKSESAALPFRAIKFNLPWDSYRSSSALDQHHDTARDPKFWEAFLDMMAENRFNALTLWNLHPFPYMIRAKNFPEASRFTDAELAEWRRLYQAIFRMAKERGIDTYVVNWNILVSPEFAKAHGLKGDNFWPNYKGEGETGELVKRYTRESVTQMLEEYPDLTAPCDCRILASPSRGRASLRKPTRARQERRVLVPNLVRVIAFVDFLDKVGRNQPCPCRSGKKFKR